MPYKKPQYRDVHAIVGKGIPQGYHVHHEDGDTSHNEPSNFHVLSPSDHASLHLAARNANPVQKRGLHEWRGTERGRRILRANAVKMRERSPEHELACGYCRVTFRTRHPRKILCSPRCAYLDRVARQPERICSECAAAFRTIDAKTTTCSYRCGWALRRRQAGVQSDRERRAPVLRLSLIHISEPTRLGMISYAVFCLKKKK